MVVSLHFYVLLIVCSYLYLQYHLFIYFRCIWSICVSPKNKGGSISPTAVTILSAVRYLLLCNYLWLLFLANVSFVREELL